MDYNITGKHLELTSSMKEAVAHAIEHSDRVHDKIIDTDIILSNEHKDFIAEAVMHVAGDTLVVKSIHDDMYVAIAEMGEKMVRSLRKSKGKRSKIDHTSIRDFNESII